jgi:DegV family protein with EDD domain
MSKVGIVADSSSCIPAEFVKEFGIGIAPVGLVIDRKRYLDTELSTEEFWKLFYKAKELPTTTGVNPSDFASVYTRLGKSTDSIVCITVSSKLSVIHKSAIQAIDMVREENPNLKIEVIDSNSGTGAHGFLVMEAARAAQAGKSTSEIVGIVKDMMPRVKWLAAPDTLKYLIKGGRAPKTAVLGEIANIKPIIGMINGTGLVENIGRARGKQKAMEKMIEIMKANIDTSKPVYLMTHYSDDIARAEKLRDMITSQIKCAEVHISPYTAIVTAHMGPVVAVSFYS